VFDSIESKEDSDLKQNNLSESAFCPALINGSLKCIKNVSMYGERSFHTRPFQCLPLNVIFEDAFNTLDVHALLFAVY